MKELSPIQSLVFRIGGIGMLLATLLPLTPFNAFASYVFLIGVLMFVSMQSLMRYQGKNIILIRLRRLQLISDIGFLLSAIVLCLEQHMSLFSNLWKLILFIAVCLQLYTAFRIPHELKKEASKNI